MSYYNATFHLVRPAVNNLSRWKTHIVIIDDSHSWLKKNNSLTSINIAKGAKIELFRLKFYEFQHCNTYTNDALSIASSTIFLRLISLFPLHTPSQVTTTLARASTTRSANASAEKPANTIECIAPIRAHANIVTTNSGIIGI